VVLLASALIGQAGGGQRGDGSLAPIRLADGREVSLVRFELADTRSPSVDQAREAPPSDYQVVRIHIRVRYPSRPFRSPTSVEIVDVLDRVYAEDYRTRQREPILRKRGELEALNALPLPATFDYQYSIPVRPRTPIKTLRIDGVEISDLPSQTAPN
jgi:hypothetical protein